MALQSQPNFDGAYMSQEQLNYFKQQLLDWLNQVETDNTQYTSQILAETARTADLLDQSVELISRNMALVNGERSNKIIEQIKAALKRIEEGSYGYCLSTGEEIGLKRLLAWPIATLSVEAQELHEKRMRQFNAG
jgi:DnaK suppressor protein